MPDQVAECHAALGDMMAADFLDRASLRGLPTLVERLGAWVTTAVAVDGDADTSGGGNGAPATYGGGSARDEHDERLLFRITSDAEVDGSGAPYASLQQQQQGEAGGVADSADVGGEEGGGDGHASVVAAAAGSLLGPNRDEVAEALLPLVLGMQRSGCLAGALAELREHASAQVRARGLY